MGFRRRAGGGKRDSAEAQIVADLEHAGVRVWRIGGTGNPDLLCWIRGEFFALEVKTEKGGLTPNQRNIPWPVVRTSEQALAAVMNITAYRKKTAPRAIQAAQNG